MKKLLSVLGLSILTLSCSKTEINEVLETSEPVMERKCASYEVLQRQLIEDPSLKNKLEEIEKFTGRNLTAARLVNGVYVIPVVVNVIYNKTTQNISLTQIKSQIDVLNKDFSATNTDYSLTPSIFQSFRSGNCNIQFVIDTIRRKSTTKSSWSTNDAMKKTSQGGLDPLSPTTKLNIWVCNLSNGILGYAQFPGGPISTDGVVIDDNAFGNTGTVIAPYNKGRTATHEVGHWLNLRHIWGDATCGSDLIDDTPLHNTANYGCPTSGHRSTCSGTPVEMTMNYMDYTDDACMYMFTVGQKSRMLTVFASGGPRNSFAQP